MEENKLCDHGCGNPAKFILKNGKCCCSKSANSCSVIIKKRIDPRIKKVYLKPEVCDYGCGKKPNFYFKYSHKWCCSNNTSNCPEVRRKNSVKNIGKKLENNKNILCEFGCNELANYIIYNDKYCCSEYTAKCLGQKKLNGLGNKRSLEDLKKEHPKLFEEEEIRENNGEFETRCKFCKDWFVPGRDQLRGRIGYIENKIGNRNCYLFCSTECKKKSLDYHKGKRNDPIEIRNFKTYSDEVIRLTCITIKKYKIKNIELRGRKFKKQLDHKYSVYEGFINNIDAKIIANINNLEIIDEFLNCSKNIKSSISKDELLSNYKE